MNLTPPPPFSPLLYPSHKHSFLFHCFFSPFPWLFLIPSHFCPALFSSFTPSLSSNLLSRRCPVLQLRQVKRSIRLTGTKTWAARVASTNFILLNDWFFNSFHGIFHNKTPFTYKQKHPFLHYFWPTYVLHLALTIFLHSNVVSQAQKPEIHYSYLFYLFIYLNITAVASFWYQNSQNKRMIKHLVLFSKIFNTLYDINNLVIHWFQYRSYLWLFPSHKRWMH